MPAGSTAGQVQAAQAELLMGLTALTNLQHLSIRLLDLSSLHQQPQQPHNQQQQQHGGPNQAAANQQQGANQNQGQAGEVFDIEIEDGDDDFGFDLDPDFVELQAPTQDAPDLACLLPLGRSLESLELRNCAIRHGALAELCR